MGGNSGGGGGGGGCGRAEHVRMLPVCHPGRPVMMERMGMGTGSADGCLGLV